MNNFPYPFVNIDITTFFSFSPLPLLYDTKLPSNASPPPPPTLISINATSLSKPMYQHIFDSLSLNFKITIIFFTSKEYVLYDLHSKSIFVTRNVIFHENIFPYSFSFPSDNSIASIDDSHN